MHSLKATDEMIVAVRDSATSAAKVDAVITIIARDYVIRRRCQDVLAPGIRCESVEHPATVCHAGYAPSGASVTWEE